MKIAFVVGEHSGDRIGADLIRGLRRRLGGDLVVTGLGGEAMSNEGIVSLFDIEELSIIGVAAILKRMPQLFRRVRQTPGQILAEDPDALVIIDSYAFSHRIARRVRRVRPDLPIINVVPPAVWAYRPGRAAEIRRHVDHAVSLFPFEPDAYRRLGGPPATYVGHPLLREPHLMAIMERLDRQGAHPPPARPPTLLLLPGSRRGEIERLMDDFGRTLAVLKGRMPEMQAVLPAIPRLADLVRAKVERWPVKPRIVTGEEEKWDAFAKADAALAASGTVALELALAGVPMALGYRLDLIGYLLRRVITGWTAALPNYIADHPLVPEHFHEMVRPELLARRLERLLQDTPERHAQLEGFAQIRRRMAVEIVPGDAAAEIVLATIAARRNGRALDPSRDAA